MVRRSIFFTYGVQIYSALISVLLIPIYVSKVGIEGFGLIGFFYLLQNVMQIFDAGLGGSLARQASITKKNPILYGKFIKQFMVVVAIFCFVSVLVFVVGGINRELVATKWLVSNLDMSVLSLCVLSIFSVLALRYLSGPFRSGLIGLECHIGLSIINFLIVSLRFPGGLLVLFLYDNSLVSYFVYQIFVAFIELIMLILYFVRQSNKVMLSDKIEIDLQHNHTSLKSLLLFSGQLSLLSVTWVVVTQVDKLILSKYINLEEFGYYSMAVSISAVILMLSAPLSQVLMSRLTVLITSHKKHEYISLYAKSYTNVIICLVPVSVFLYIFSKEVIYLWTGDEKIALLSSFYTSWLVLGNVISVLMTLVFLLQYSVGRLKAHTTVYLVYSVFIVPLSVIIAQQFKGEGAVLFWFFHNLVFFVVWGGMVHYKFINGFNRYLWFRVLIPAFIISYVIMKVLGDFLIFKSMTGFYLLIVLLFIGMVGLAGVLLYFYLYRGNNKASLNKIELTDEFFSIESKLKSGRL